MATLGWLTKDGKNVSQIDISKMARIDPNTASQILRGLDAKKFIIRKHSINEKNKNPMITHQGAETLSKALPAVEKADATFFSTLNTTESQALLKLFHKLTTK